MGVVGISVIYRQMPPLSPVRVQPVQLQGVTAHITILMVTMPMDVSADRMTMISLMVGTPGIPLMTLARLRIHQNSI